MAPPYSSTDWTGLFVPGCAMTSCCCSVILVGGGCRLVGGGWLVGVVRPVNLSLNDLALLNIITFNVSSVVVHFSLL